MPNMSQLTIDNVTYDLKDTEGRAHFEDLKAALNDQTGKIYTNLIDVDTVYENKTATSQAMQEAGVVEYTDATNLFSTRPFVLNPGTYYIRSTYSGSGKIITWNKDLGESRGYPVGYEQVNMQNQQAHKRTNKDGIDVFEWELDLDFTAYVVIVSGMGGSVYKSILSVSYADISGMDQHYDYGKVKILDLVTDDEVSALTTLENSDYYEMLDRTDHVYTNIINTAQVLENKIVDSAAMQTAGVVTYTDANNICSTPVIQLKRGTYYIRAGYTSSGRIVYWNKTLGDARGYPVGYGHVNFSALGKTRTSKNGVDIFEYALTLDYDCYVVISSHMHSGEYKSLLSVSAADIRGSDETFSYGECELINSANEKRVDKIINDQNLDYLSAEKVFGTQASDTPDANYNLPVNFAANTILVGPIFFHDDVEISCDNSVEYRVSFLYLNNNHSQTKYTFMFGYTSDKHIIGVSPEYANSIKYYIHVKFTNNAVPSSFESLLSLFYVKNARGKNPLGIIHSRFWNVDDGSYAPSGYGSTIPSRLWFKTVLPFKAMVYFSNPNIVYSAVVKNGDAVTNATEAAILSPGETTFLIRNKDTTDTIFMQKYQTFDELYNYLGFRIEPCDLKRIDGARANNHTFINDQLTYGESVVSAINGALAIRGTGIQFSHVPFMNIKDGVAYITFQASDANVETHETTSVYLAEIDIESETLVNIYKIGGAGTYGGITFSGPATNCPSIIVGDKLHILFNALMDGDRREFHTEFDITTKTFTTNVCNLVINSESFVFNSSNLFEKFGAFYGIKKYVSEIVFNAIQTKDNETYYASVTSGDYHDGKAAIFKTTDFTSWEPFIVLPAECACDCEMPMIFWGNYIIGASRHHYSDQTLYIWKYALSDGRIVDSVQINDCATRPTFFMDANNNLNLIHGLDARQTSEWLVITTENLAQSYIKALMHRSPQGIGYSSVVKYDNKLYMAVQCNPVGENSPKIHFLELPT